MDDDGLPVGAAVFAILFVLIAVGWVIVQAHREGLI